MFIFIYSSTCEPSLGADLAFLVGAVMAIPICAKQTGANLNPGVSFAMTFKSNGVKFSYLSLLWVYIKAQVCGAVLAMIVAATINDVYQLPLYPQVLIRSYVEQDGVPDALVVFRIIMS
jgi:glycerol uptake facilitator-like aquaporin